MTSVLWFLKKNMRVRKKLMSVVYLDGGRTFVLLIFFLLFCIILILWLFTIFLNRKK